MSSAHSRHDDNGANSNVRRVAPFVLLRGKKRNHPDRHEGHAGQAEATAREGLAWEFAQVSEPSAKKRRA